MKNRSFITYNDDEYFYYWESGGAIYYGAATKKYDEDNSTLSTILKSYLKDLYEKQNNNQYL